MTRNGYGMLGRALNEVMDEMALQKRKFGKASAADTAQQQPQYEELKGGKISLGPIEPGRATINGVEKEVVKVKLNRVFNADAQAIADAINSSCPSDIVKAEAYPGEAFRVVLSIVPDKTRLDDKFFDTLCNAISATGHYIPGAVRLIRQSLPDELKNIALGSDIEMAQVNITKNWKEMLEKLQDPAIRTKLLSFQTTDAYASAYGHILSPENVVKIRAQFPSASFVCEASTWEKYFNRQVMPGATPISVVQPDYVDERCLDDAARSLRYSSFSDAMTQTDWSPQVKNQIRIMAVNMKGTKLTFHTVKMYDVSETIPPSNPADDVWTNKIGLSDNITGQLNSKAEAYDTSMTDPDEQAKREENKEKVKNRNAESQPFQNQAYAIDRALVAEKVYMVPYEDLMNNQHYDTYIQCGAYEYAKKVLPEGYGVMELSKDDLQRAKNRARFYSGVEIPKHVDKVAKLVAMAVAISCGITELDPRFSVEESERKNLAEDEVRSSFAVASKLISAIVKYKRPSGIKKMKIGKTENNESRTRRRGRAMVNENGERMFSTNQFLQMANRYFGPGSSLYIGDDAAGADEDVMQNDMTSEGRIRRIIGEEIAKVIRIGRR